MGIHRTREHVETAPLATKLEFHHGVFVPPPSYFDSSPLPTEWLQAVPALLSSYSPPRRPPRRYGDLYSNSKAAGGSEGSPAAPPAGSAGTPAPSSSVERTPTPAGTPLSDRPVATARQPRSTEAAAAAGGSSDGESSAYSDYSNVFDDDAGSPQRSAVAATPTGGRLEPPAFGTMWKVQVQVHAIHGLRKLPTQSCRVVCEVFNDVLSTQSQPAPARRASALLSDSVGNSTNDVFASLGLAPPMDGGNSPSTESKAADDVSSLFVFNSTSTQRMLARATNLRTFLRQAHSLLMEVIVTTPLSPEARKEAGSDGTSDSSDEETEKLERYMCEIDLESLQTKTIVDGAFRIMETSGKEVREAAKAGTLCAAAPHAVRLVRR